MDMPTRIENLERLARFRADGLLTDAEFEAEKAKLLAAPLDTIVEPFAQDAGGDPDASRSKFGLWAWVIAVAFLFGSVALAWDRFGLGGDSAVAGGQGLIDQLTGADPLWVKTEHIDPMTDIKVVSVERTFEVDGFTIETTISCRSDKVAFYNFKTFNSDGSGAEAVSQLYNNAIGYYHVATFRPDDEPAGTFKYLDPRYNNVLEFAQSAAVRGFGPLFGNPTIDLTKAGKLAVKLHLKQGEPTFVIDQSDAMVSSVLAGCIVPTDEGRQGAGLSNGASETATSHSEAADALATKDVSTTSDDWDDLGTKQQLIDDNTQKRIAAERRRDDNDEAERQRQQDIQNKAAEQRERLREAQKQHDQVAFCNTITSEGRKDAEYMRSKGC